MKKKSIVKTAPKVKKKLKHLSLFNFLSFGLLWSVLMLHYNLDELEKQVTKDVVKKSKKKINKKILAVLLFSLFFSTSPSYSCEFNIAASNALVDEIQADLVERFPFSVIIAAMDILDDITELEPIPFYDFNFSIKGTSYYPLTMFDVAAMDTFFSVIRWLFLLLVLSRVSILIISNFF